MQRLLQFNRAISRTIIAVLAIGFVQIISAPAAPAAVVLTINETDAALKFDYATADKSGTRGSQGTGVAVNDRVIYRNAGTYGGVSVDVVVTTVAITSGSVSNYDNPGSATTATGSGNYWMINTVGGDARFRFEFFKGGTYTGLSTGIPVILQNLKVTSIDIDTSGTGANQYSDFTGFQKYSMMNPTNLAVIAQPVTTGEPNRIRFIANLAGSRSSAPEDQVMVKYDAVSLMEIAFGNIKAGSTNYFGLIFGGWPGAGTPVEYPNLFNSPPTSSNVTLGVSDSQSAPSVLSLSAFGNYADADFNPFTHVKIASTPASGSLQKFNGSTWVDVAAGDIITVAEIEAGKLRYMPAGTPADTSFTFFVFDGLDYSTNTYTTSLQVKSATQVITFPNPGTKAPGQSFPSSAVTSATGETVTLTSNTPGICTVNNVTGQITTITSGICSITATQPGNSTYPAATPVTQEFPVTSKTPQVITFPNPGTKVESTVAFSSSATTNASGLFVTLTSADPTICTVNNSTGGVPTITPLKAGTCTITATQAGNSTYDPATPVTVSFPITAPGGGATTTGSLEVHTAGAENLVLTGTLGATLYGLITPSGNTMTYKFCWTRSSSAVKAGVITAAAGNNNQVKCSNGTSVSGNGPNVPVNIPITQYTKDGQDKSLSSTKTYYFQVIGYVGSKPYYGEVMSFYLPGSNDDWVNAKTDAVTSFTETTANLTGGFNSTQKSTTQQTYCLTTNPKQIAIGTTNPMQNQNLANCKELTSSTVIAAQLPTTKVESATAYSISGLTGDTWYYFQTRAYDSNKKKLAFGKIVAFKTTAKSPAGTTLPVTVFESTSAVLPGSAISNGETSTVTFEYSSTSGSLTQTASAGTIYGSSNVSVYAKTAPLTVGTRYYYRVKVVRASDGVIAYGAEKSFILGAPSVATLAPTNLETDTATTWTVKLNGFIKPQGFLATPSFCWGSSAATSAGTVNTAGVLQGCTDAAVLTPDSTTANMGFNLVLTGVTQNTTYYYQAKGLNREYLSSQLWSYGEVKSFTTALAPEAITQDPTDVGATSAQLNGVVTSIGDSATVSFCLSKSNATTPDDPSILLNCDSRLSISQNANSELNGNSQVATKIASGLAKTTTYYYQIFASNKMGSSTGEIKSFTTNAGGPLATTVSSQYESSTAATIFGSINSNGSNTTAYFCLSTDSTTATVAGGDSMTACSYTSSPFSILSSVSGNTSQSALVTGLNANTTYYFQIFGTNARGETTYGAVLSFKLNGMPKVVTNSSVTALTSTTATISGTADRNSYGSALHSSFCLGQAEDLSTIGVLVDCDPTGMTFWSLPNSSSTSSMSEVLTGLDPGTTYFYQAYVALTSDTTTPILGARYYSFKTHAQVTFDPNGGTGNQETQTASGSAALRSFSGIGYTLTNSVFVKWNTAADGSGTDYADGASFSFGDNVVLYAIWSDASSTYSITYDLNGGSGTTPTEGNKSSGQTFTAASGSGLSKSGFTFGGWSCSSTTYAAGATVTVGSANITCTAIWNAVTPTAPVVKKKLVLRWNDPSPINFGTPLSGTQLNGSTDALATCVYTPALGTILAPGEYTLSVTCTPVDGTNYEPVSGTVKLTVKKVKGKPRIIWFNPSPITYPTPLTGTQLNAVASVPGTYAYNPAAGTVLAPGRHKLNVKFTPTNKDDNEEIEANVTIDVLAPKVPGTTPTKPADTSTATTPAVVPTKPASAPDTKTATTPALKPMLQTAGVTEVVTVKPNEDKTGIIVSSENWSLQIKSTTQFVQGGVEDTSARVVIEKGNTVTTSGTGFKPFSQVDVYVYSTPTWLGAVMTDEFGNFTTTLPMPKSLPEGDHTFQAQGQTPESKERVAAIPITLVPASIVNKPGSMRFEVYFAMNGVSISKAEKAKTVRMINIAKGKIASGAKVTVEISGWVQPNPNPGAIKYLSTNRAKNVRDLVQSLGLKGAYTLKYPGLDKDNIPSARHASVIIKWSKSK